MKLRNILLVLFLAAIISSTLLSSTLARYTDEFTGGDTALIAAWNMGARGEDDVEGEFYNKGFTFNLFDSRSVQPQDHGEKSFAFRSGGSDVAIAYDVKMNMVDLLRLTTDELKAVIGGVVDQDVFAPFIFKITAKLNEGASGSVPVIFSPYDETSPYYGAGWFRPKDLELDEEGYFSVFAGSPVFPPGSADEVAITVAWQWNTSFYLNDTDIPAVMAPNNVVPDPSGEITGDYLPYYQAAHDQYYGSGGLLERYEAAQNKLELYFEVHGSPDSNGNWPPHSVACPMSEAEHNAHYNAIADPEERQAFLYTHGGIMDPGGGIVWTEHAVMCTADHFGEYSVLEAKARSAHEACRTSLLQAYDDYDTFAADILAAREVATVLFQISGEQVSPQ